jgi:CBS domain-containing protein
MTPGVVAVRPDASLVEAAQLMRAQDIGDVVVADGQDVVGVLTDRDITVRATAAGKNPATTPVTEVMTPEVIYVFEDQDVKDAAKLMEEHQLRRLVVLNRDKKLVGIVSLGDLAVDTHDEQLAGNTLEAVSEPAEPKR